MTPTVPIPTSIADACAAHDRHRLDVLDALLDEAAPSAVRELLGAALDLCASLRADRDTLAAKLDAAPKVCAIHSYEHGPGPCMTCGAWPPGTRELIAACQTRIVGLESAANERSAEVARVDALFEEARGALVDVATALNVVVGVASPDVASRCRAEVARMTARVAELEAAGRAIKITPTLLAAAPVGSRDGSVTPAAAAQAERLLSLAGELLIAPPTSPPAARPVFAEVSEDELIRLFYVVGTDGIDHGEQCPPIDSSDRNGLRAVLARLEVSLVAPVDLAAIERAVKAYHNASGEHAVPADALGTGQWRAAVLAMTDAFLAAGIPVTPEVDK